MGGQHVIQHEHIASVPVEYYGIAIIGVANRAEYLRLDGTAVSIERIKRHLFQRNSKKDGPLHFFRQAGEVEKQRVIEPNLLTCDRMKAHGGSHLMRP